MDLLSRFIDSVHQVSVPQDILLTQFNDEQRLQTLQKQIAVIERYHDFFLKNSIAVVLSLDRYLARIILSSDVLLRKLRSLSALELALSESFPDFKAGRDNPVLSALSDNFKLTLSNFGSGKAPAKAVYDNLFTRIKLDRYFLQQALKRASFPSMLKALIQQLSDHCQQFIVQGVDSADTLEKISSFAFSGLQGALFPPVPETQLTTLTEPPGGFSGWRC
ncbi:EAL domain-containing protein [Mixta intestinalis]|uniref:Anti-FlhC(2)FlhD(4) factor YdiV n=1 Tax=Mixta intestinalis TaxID=1615494 RepID=A0A6P1PXV8_9GAMM|nr:EAL domain-containing protein [Mixta intestinalis]QHM70874.1 Putative anti-FlhC(2)FlhD(4) factor YdiV [Mixta intestinalis]